MAPRKGRDHHNGAAANSEVPPPTESDLLNLSVLRKYDPEITQILHVAPYAVAYVYDPETQGTGWEKNGVEGSLFICQLCESYESSERYKIVMLNRRGLDNFTFEVTGDDQVDFTEELIMFQNEIDGQMQVYGLWVFSEPAPSSTAHQPQVVTEILKQCNIQVKAEREERARMLQENRVENVPVSTQQSGGVSARQLSLSEIFGHTRKQDDGWNTQGHAPESELPIPPQMFQASRPQYQFNPTSGTSQQINPVQQPFAHAIPPSHQSPPASGVALGSQQQHLLGLFQNAQLPPTH